MKHLVWFIVVSGLFISNNLWGKVVQGKVENRQGQAVSNVLVEVRETTISTTTDQNGYFELNLEPGEYVLDIKGGSAAHFHQSIQVTDAAQGVLLLSLADEPDHKLVVRANPLEHTKLDMATPTVILAGDELTLKRSSTLGDILQYEPGISVSSFGPAVSRPVIRGLAGSRVQITNNQMTIQDAASTSADHDVGMEPLLAEQVEVIKGPATLLYGSSAIGGVVNISDRKISPNGTDELSGGVELRLGDSATGEETGVFTLDGGNGVWSWHLDGFTSSTDDIEIPGLSESLVLREAEEAEEGEGEHGEEEHGEESAGVLENSSSETDGGSFGTTFTREWGYIGASVSSVQKNYGIPGHEEHGHEEEVGGEPEEEEIVRIDMEQLRYDLQAELENPFAHFDSWFVGYALTDYQHIELEGEETGTRFDNKAWELRSYLKHESQNGWSGIVGIQASERDFSAIGEEAFVPPSVTESIAVYAIEEKKFGDIKWEFGARFESQSISSDGISDIDESGLSFSIGNVYTLTEHNIIALNLSRSQRFASAEELLSDGPHLATSSFEIGDSSIDKETSTNFDFSYRFESERISGELNFYYNQFNDFIYAANVDGLDPCASQDAIDEAEAEELLLVCYKQQDADFKGMEFQMDVLLNPESAHAFTLGVVADVVRAEFDDGTYVPRIPPAKAGLSLNYDYQAISAGLSWLHYEDQTRVSDNELLTRGFDMLDFDLAYRLPIETNELFLFLKAKNLLDEEARDHSSFVKDLAPRAGRSISMGARYTF